MEITVLFKHKLKDWLSKSDINYIETEMYLTIFNTSYFRSHFDTEVTCSPGVT